ncbi:TetR/AcrR family transcriptional regulator [Mycobacterium sp. MFM001]|uniref:TetR/AcrR family transcriptional regulator n=1 Tax=Mycobacterium sp. MFM001 TaxID=2049453 RepID=UPI00192E2AA1|nr:TetR/AcrR family transcriptional regulator [Mycobacterium sp. MFM001]
MARSTSGPVAPRRVPQQQRSRLMVKRILDAAKTVLIERGYDDATTNRIAEAAGISPGSLYQYFPNKETIIAAVIDRYTDHIADRVTAHLSAHIGEPEEPQRIYATLDILLEAMEEEPGLLRALIEQTPRLGLGNKITAFEDRVGELAAAHLRLRSLPVRHAQTTIWLLVRTVEHLTTRYLLDRPPIERDEFLNELTALVIGYFRIHSESPGEGPT